MGTVTMDLDFYDLLKFEIAKLTTEVESLKKEKEALQESTCDVISTVRLNYAEMDKKRNEVLKNSFTLEKHYNSNDYNLIIDLEVFKNILVEKLKEIGIDKDLELSGKTVREYQLFKEVQHGNN